MRCRPGDLAYIVCAAPSFNRRYVTVLSRAPVDLDFALPDGQIHEACYASMGPCWVCEFVSPIEAPTTVGTKRRTVYAAVPDKNLRPIRDPGDDAKDEMLRPLPEGVAA